MSAILDSYKNIQNMQVANSGRTSNPTPTSRGPGGGRAISVADSYGEEQNLPAKGQSMVSSSQSVVNPVVNSVSSQGPTTLDTIRNYVGMGASAVNLTNTAARVGASIASSQGATSAANSLGQVSNVLGTVGQGASYLLTAYNAYQVASKGVGQGRGANLAISTIPYAVKALTPVATTAAGGGTAASGSGASGGAAAGGIAAAAAASVRQGYVTGSQRMQESDKGSNRYSEGDIQSTPFSLPLDLGLGSRMQRQGNVTTPSASFMNLPRDFERTAYSSLENVFSGRISDSFRDWRDLAERSTVGNVKNAIEYYKEDPSKLALAAATGGVSDIFDSLF
jgi:hypothetical protein